MAGKGTISITFKLDGDGKGFRAIAQDANGLRAVMASTLEQSEALKTSLVNWSAAVQGLQGVDKAVNSIAGQLNSITSESEEFNKAMKEANTMASKDSAGFKQLKGEVADLAKEIPIARDQLANGLYQTISNGVPEDNWIEFLNTSARSAVGGLADINKVVGVTSTLIKNYGLEWSAAADIQDKIQLTAKNGVTSFEQLAQALPRVTGNAASLGVSIDELMGTFATLTGVSGNTAEVSTQLAAIFTALVKPSSEAADMAAKMGIQFDAASVKAAGGFQNFLNQLDGSVKAYAQANGVLEQEVYSKLFGSAEAIRALIPLQGELADKFTANVANMVNSAGTMDAAYADMSSHGEAVNQMLRNQWAAVIDVISGATSAAQPYINFTAGLLSTGSSAAILITTFKQLNIQQVAVATRAKLASVAMVTLGLRGKSAAAVVRVFSSAMKGGAYSATAFKISLRGLLIATGIGAAIAAVTTIIEFFVNAADDAAESVEKLDDATDDYTQAAAAAKVQIDRDVKALGDLIKAKKNTKEAVQRLNETYGELFGVHKTAEEWYKILTEKSQLYIKQIGYEAQAKALAAKVAEASINKELALERKAELERAGVDSRGRVKKDSVWGEIWVESEEYKQVLNDLEAAEVAEAELQKRLNAITKKTGEINRGLAGANSEVKVSENDMQLSAQTPDKPVPKESIAAIDNQIKDLRLKVDLAIDNESRAGFYAELVALEKQKRIIEFNYKFPEVPKRPDILPEIDTTFETDIKKIKPQIIDVSEEIANLGERAKTPTEEAAGAFADLGSSIGGLGNALEIPELNVAGTMAQAIATMVAGYAQATAESSALGPFGWIAFAAAGLAQLTAIVASVKSLPAFANGGIVSGPTVGLIGEYAGASNNPEVVAPLDKLRGMLNPVGEPGGEVVFKISGDKLEGVLRRRQNYINRL